ncbi:MAG: histidinol-phosphatase [Opitutales bacterium]
MISNNLLPFVHTLVEKSATIITPFFGNKLLEVELKGDDTPVTHADRKAEEVMRDLIHKHYPNHGIIGEEYGQENPDAEFVWVLDPIDGTKSFASGCPLFGTLVCLLHEGRPILGAINQPLLKQFCFGDNHKTTLNGAPVQMRPTSQLAEATLLTTDIRDVYKYQRGLLFEELISSTRLFRTWGDCYGYLLLATGWADIMMDPRMEVWDLMPILPIIRGANGTITRWDGGDPLTGNSIVAANKRIHGRVIEMLNTAE